MQKKQWPVFLVLSNVMLNMMTIGIIIPVLPKMLAEITNQNLQESSVYSGWLLTIYAIVQFFCTPLLGRLSDRFGRKPLLLITALGLGFDFLMTAFVQSFAQLVIVRIFAATVGASNSVANAYIADMSDKNTLNRNFGLVGASIGAGFSLGPLIGGSLGVFDIHFPFYAAALLAFINFTLCALFLPESLPTEKRRNIEWKKFNPIHPIYVFFCNPKTRTFAFIYLMIYTAEQAFYSIWTYYGIEKFAWNEFMIGLAVTYFGVNAFFFQGFMVKFIERKLTEKKMAYYGAIIDAFSFTLYALISSSWMSFVLSSLFELGAVGRVALLSVISRQHSTSEQGEMQGNINAILSFAGIIGPPIMTYSFYFGVNQPKFYFPGLPFIISAACMIVAFLLIHKVFRKLEQKQEPAPEQKILNVPVKD